LKNKTSKDFKGKKILVTGGAGFIGGHLVSTLLKSQAEVCVVDINILPKSLFALESLSKKVQLKNVDVREKEKILSLFKENNFDYAFHLAAVASVLSSYDDPSLTFETNIMGTVNMLEAARENKNVKGIIVASSDKAYGTTNKAYTEDSPLKGQDPFGVSKSSADLICQAYYKTYGTPIVITRFSNVYGEGDLHFDRLIPEICRAIVKNEEFKVRSDGTFIRDYIYIKDAVNGYMTLLNNVERIKGEVYNFSSPDSLSVLEVIKKVNSLIDKKLIYKIVNNSKNEIPYQHLDDSKVKRLGWKPNYDLTSTLKSIMKWYRSVL